MKKITGLIGLLGLLAATGLFVWQGLDVVLALFASAGFGVVWASLFHFISMSFNARAWQVLLPSKNRPKTLFFLWAVWLRESVNGLLPVARIGGEIITARLLMQRGLKPPSAVASLVVDVTLALISQYFFTILGLALLFWRGGQGDFLSQLGIGLLLFVPVVAAVLFVQKFGLFKIIARIVEALFGDRFAKLVGSATMLDRTIKRFYLRRWAIVACTFWQLVGWSMGAGEIWLFLHFIGHSVGVAEALIIESLIQALSSGAFVVPAALGVQEGGFVLIGGMVGLAPDTALALALARRARDLLVLVPALLYWQFQAGKRLLKPKSA